MLLLFFFFFFQAEDGIRDSSVTGVQTCALPISTELTFGLKPAWPSVTRASVWLCPTTFGTAISFGACATVRLTLLSALTDVPPLGDCASTVPSGCDADVRLVTAPSCRPALVSVASAADCDWPTTSGTLTGAGPLETGTTTGLPGRASVPADALLR